MSDMRTFQTICFIVLSIAIQAQGAEKMNIWHDDSPQLKGVDEKHIPTLHLYHGPSTKEKKPAVLICPAGGYKHHSDMSAEIKEKEPCP